MWSVLRVKGIVGFVGLDLIRRHRLLERALNVGHGYMGIREDQIMNLRDALSASLGKSRIGRRNKSKVKLSLGMRSGFSHERRSTGTSIVWLAKYRVKRR
jgi:hypothetical protein